MKKSPEPIILAIVLGLLALVAAGLAYTFPSIADLTGVPSMDASGHQPLSVKEQELKTKLGSLTDPAVWNTPTDNHRLFISDGYLFYAAAYPSGTYIRKDDGRAITNGGVLINWYRKYHLDFTDPNIDREDPDNDGFSNKTEFFNASAPGKPGNGDTATNPLDPASHPAYVTRLRLQKFDERPFHIQFVGVVKLNGENEFQISLADVPPNAQPNLKKTGDPLNYENYIIGPYTENIVQEEDKATHIQVTVDRSTLELDKPEIGFKIVLPLRQIVSSPESTADFVMLMPSEVGKTIKVARGKTFALPFVPGSEYLVIDVKPEGAIIRDTKTKQDINIPKLDPKEWDDVPAPAGSSADTKPRVPNA